MAAPKLACLELYLEGEGMPSACHSTAEEASLPYMGVER